VSTPRALSRARRRPNSTERLDLGQRGAGARPVGLGVWGLKKPFRTSTTPRRPGRQQAAAGRTAHQTITHDQPQLDTTKGGSSPTPRSRSTRPNQRSSNAVHGKAPGGGRGGRGGSWTKLVREPFGARTRTSRRTEQGPRDAEERRPTAARGPAANRRESKATDATTRPPSRRRSSDSAKRRRKAVFFFFAQSKRRSWGDLRPGLHLGCGRGFRRRPGARKKTRRRVAQGARRASTASCKTAAGRRLGRTVRIPAYVKGAMSPEPTSAPPLRRPAATRSRSPATRMARGGERAAHARSARGAGNRAGPTTRSPRRLLMGADPHRPKRITTRSCVAVGRRQSVATRDWHSRAASGEGGARRGWCPPPVSWPDRAKDGTTPGVAARACGAGADPRARPGALRELSGRAGFLSRRP